MYRYTTNPSGCKSSPSYGITSGWDPDTVLGLIHPSRGEYRCTGDALSKGRRCMNPVASFGAGQDILVRLAREDISKALESPDMRVAAYYTICKLHRNTQADTVSRKWCSLLREWASQNSRPVKTEPRSSFAYPCGAEPSERYDKVKVEHEAEYTFENLLRTEYGPLPRKNMTIKEMLRFWAEKMAEEDKDDQEDHEYDQWVKQERGGRSHSEERRQREKEARKKEERRQREKEAREKEERLQREKEAHARAQEERQRREQQKREQEAQRKAEQQRKETEAREERIRLAKERREKEAAEKAAQEAQIWKESWDSYTEAWDAVKTFKSQRCAARQHIAWPVKSGQRSDVNEANIKLFFRKAPPKNLVDTAESRFKFITSENRRWHTDKLMQQFGTEIISGEFKEAFDTIARVVVVLRQDAQRERKD